jgi:hypothetical protein
MMRPVMFSVAVAALQLQRSRGNSGVRFSNSTLCFVLLGGSPLIVSTLVSAK